MVNGLFLIKSKEANMKKHTTDTILVSYDCNPPDNAVLIVGRKIFNQSIKIINTFQGDKATELYNKLVTVRK